jgi:hypothetical protein
VNPEHKLRIVKALQRNAEAGQHGASGLAIGLRPVRLDIPFAILECQGGGGAK